MDNEIRKAPPTSEAHKPSISNTEKTIKTKQGREILVDEEDFENLNQYKWYGVIYPSRYLPKYSTQSMHRMLMGNPEGMQVDHINGDGFDNRKANLRICTRSENLYNQKKYKGQSSYKGVSWFKPTKKWRANINFKKKYILLGYFNTELAAAMVYDMAAVDLHGEFARLNFKGAIHG